MLPSGNDAAMALARYCGDKVGENGIASFIELMNMYAKKFGMQDTTYSNPHGLADTRNKSSARDICRLTYFFLKDKVLQKIVSTKSYTAVINNDISG